MNPYPSTLTFPRGRRMLRPTNSNLSGGAALDALFVFWALENSVDEDARRMNLIGVELAEFDELFDFGDDVIGGSGHHRIEVARGLAVDEIAPAVALPRLVKTEISAQAPSKDLF